MTDNTPTTKQDEGGLLLPCPFCQGHAASEVDEYEWDAARVVCRECGATGPWADLADHPTKAAAIAHVARAWNTRAPATPPHNEDGLRKALEKVRGLVIVPVSDPHAGAQNGKELIRAKAIARQALGDIPSG